MAVLLRDTEEVPPREQIVAFVAAFGHDGSEKGPRAAHAYTEHDSLMPLGKVGCTLFEDSSMI